jgi:hypothetical protein
MRLSPKEKKPQSAWQDIAIFAAVLAFLCFSVNILFSFGRTKAPPSPPASSPITAGRSPASRASPSKGASTQVLRLPCLKQVAANAISSEARLLQIQAPLCSGTGEDDAKGSEGWTAVNESSGEEILVFVNGTEKTLSTSYFSLKEGRNQLLFTYKKHKLDQVPTIQRKVEITRTSTD